MNQVQQSIQEIPLSQINIIGYLLDNLAKINCEFTFENKNNETINPIHYFSLLPNSTICNFTMLTGETVLKGQVQEKKQAFKTYTQAQSEGKKTALIEKISSTDYKVTVGNVEPGLTVIVSFDYIGTLEQDKNSRYKFSIPTNMSVKYFSSTQTQKDFEYQKQINKITYSPIVPYHFDFELRWMSSNKFIEYESNIKSICSEYIESDNLIIFNGQGLPLQGDINVFVKIEPNPTAYAWYDREKSKGYVIAGIKIPEHIVQNNNQSKKNYQFILDRSCSMEGTRIDKAKEALKLFVDKIPPESYFNVISFGNDYSSIWSNSVPAHSFFKESCMIDIDSYSANMGGTEIQDCLSDCIDLGLKVHKLDAKKTCPDTYENVIIILTDGDVGSIDRIFQMVKSKQSEKSINTRIFAIGLGNGTSKQFLKGISDLTFGDYTMVGDNDDLNEPITQILDIVTKQYYTQIKLASINDLDSKTDSKQEKNIYTNVNTIYPGKNYSMVFEANLDQLNEFVANGIVIKGINPINNNPVEWKTICQFESDETTNKNFDFSIIKQIYSNQLINKLEHSLEYDSLDRNKKESITNEIIKISFENNIMNSFTSFVLVDKSGEYDVKQIGKDLIISHSNSIDPVELVRRKIGLGKLLESNKNISVKNINSISHYDEMDNDYHESVKMSANSYYCTFSASNLGTNKYEECDEECDELDGGMDMFGGGCGGSSGYYRQKHNTDVNLYQLNKLLNPTNGSYKFENDSWKLICYISQKDFDEHCNQVEMTRVLFFNFIILLELIKIHDIKSHLLKEYFELKYPGLYVQKKYQVEKLYIDYINELKQQKEYVSNNRWGGGDY